DLLGEHLQTGQRQVQPGVGTGGQADDVRVLGERLVQLRHQIRLPAGAGLGEHALDEHLGGRGHGPDDAGDELAVPGVRPDVALVVEDDLGVPVDAVEPRAAWQFGPAGVHHDDLHAVPVAAIG